MGKVTLFIACSIDGYIARSNDSLDWLNAFPNPDNIDHGYSDLLNRTSCIIMGRRTYSEVLGFGIDWPYSGITTYVVSNDSSFKTETQDTRILNGNIAETVRKIKIETSKDIWLAGGGKLVSYFLNNDLIDKMIISVIPTILGEGIPLFPNRPKETKWTLIENTSFSTGIVNLTYEKK